VSNVVIDARLLKNGNGNHDIAEIRQTSCTVCDLRYEFSDLVGPETMAQCEVERI